MAGTIVTDTIKSSFSTPTVFQNTSGTEVGQLCRAWVNFVGASGTRNGSFNVSSVTRNTTGDYTVNFTNAMADTVYSAVATTYRTPDAYASVSYVGAYTSSSVRIINRGLGSSPTTEDALTVNVAVFR